MRSVETWLARHWVVAAGFMAGALVAVAPGVGLATATLLIFLHGPGYMIHQVEEHAQDRFRAFTNRHVFGGREVLTTRAVLVVNLPVVWGVNLLALYAAVLWGPAWGLVAPYLMLVNAVAHLATLVRFRTYNPGVVTSVVLFLPLSLATIYLIGFSGGAAPQIVGAALSILTHAAIIGAMLRRSRALGVRPASGAKNPVEHDAGRL